MEACAENHLPLVILDRPNPNGHYIDGPVLEKQFKAYEGMHSVPIVYGMTIGEYARMINGEKWLAGGILADLSIVSCSNYTHKTEYVLPINPSPNLRNMQAVYLYPSLALFEGTIMSFGGGTDFPYQMFGHPNWPDNNFCFEPRNANSGTMASRYINEKNCGKDLRMLPLEQLRQNGFSLKWLIYAYWKMGKRSDYFNPYFLRLIGTKDVQEKIKAGWSEREIKSLWKRDIDNFKAIRRKYLLYEDF